MRIDADMDRKTWRRPIPSGCLFRINLVGWTRMSAMQAARRPVLAEQ
jgi:hypothetical protein